MGAAVPPGPSLCQRSKQGGAGPIQRLRRVVPSAEKPAGPRRHSRPRRRGTDRWPLGGHRLNAGRHHASHGRPELERKFRTVSAGLRSIPANRCGRQVRHRRPLLASTLSGRSSSPSAQSSQTPTSDCALNLMVAASFPSVYRDRNCASSSDRSIVLTFSLQLIDGSANGVFLGEVATPETNIDTFAKQNSGEGGATECPRSRGPALSSFPGSRATSENMPHHVKRGV